MTPAKFVLPVTQRFPAAKLPVYDPFTPEPPVELKVPFSKPPGPYDSPNNTLPVVGMTKLPMPMDPSAFE